MEISQYSYLVLILLHYWTLASSRESKFKMPGFTGSGLRGSIINRSSRCPNDLCSRIPCKCVYIYIYIIYIYIYIFRYTYTHTYTNTCVCFFPFLQSKFHPPECGPSFIKFIPSPIFCTKICHFRYRLAPRYQSIEPSLG